MVKQFMVKKEPPTESDVDTGIDVAFKLIDTD